MIPIKFPEANLIIAENQEGVLPLPVFRDFATETITSCWELTDEEVEEVIKNRKIWVNIRNGRNPISPFLLLTSWNLGMTSTIKIYFNAPGAHIIKYGQLYRPDKTSNIFYIGFILNKVIENSKDDKAWEDLMAEYFSNDSIFDIDWADIKNDNNKGVLRKCIVKNINWDDSLLVIEGYEIL